MGSGIYSIGVSALQVAQLGLATTSHNIANANTEGYNRQRIIQASNVATLTGAGYVGQGAHVSTIERIYSGYLATQVNTAQNSVSKLESYSSSISQLNDLLMDADAGLSSALEAFFSGVQQVSANPTSLTTRQTMVSGAETLVSRFHSLDALVDAQYQGINSQIQGYVGSINSYAQEIATLNKQIIVAESSNNQTPNDLYDQRDQLVSELNKLVGVKTTTNTNGSLNVYFGNGQQLVVGGQASSLSATTSSQDPTRLTIGLVNPAGIQELPESVLTGGSLAGVLEYRAQTLDRVANELGRIATTVALTFNAQHALGQDLLGNIDGDSAFVANFFSIGAPSVVANSNNPSGSADVSASFLAPSVSSDGTFYTNLTASDYRLDVDASGNLSLTRLSDNVRWPSPSEPPITSLSALNTAIANQGFEIGVTAGTFQSGSSYLIQPTRNAAQGFEVNDTIAADVRYIAAAAPIRTSAGTANLGGAVISAGSVTSVNSVPATGSQIIFTYDDATPPVLSVSIKDSSGTITPGVPATVPFTSGASIAYGSLEFKITGAPTDGDTFVIERNSNGVSDNRNALLLAQLQSSKTTAGNTASFATVYAQLVSDVGNKGREVTTILAAQKSLLTAAQDARDSVSGVNLDEEAANLLQYQQSYQAAAKMLQIASELFDSILAIG